MNEKTKEAELASITPEQAKKLGPQAIVIGNARTLVHSDLVIAKDLMKKSLEYMGDLLSKPDQKDYDFRSDPKALIGIQLQLASLSLAAEYWIAKIKKDHIQVYSPAEMPKA